MFEYLLVNFLGLDHHFPEVFAAIIQIWLDWKSQYVITCTRYASLVVEYDMFVIILLTRYG